MIKIPNNPDNISFETVAEECSQLDFSMINVNRKESHIQVCDLFDYLPQTIDSNSTVKANAWSRKEQAMLVGNVFHHMFISPNLTKFLWKKIYVSFKTDCRNFNVRSGIGRTQSAVERHFKDLKKRNKYVEGTLFKSLHEQWKRYKEESKK
eukprot:snap_masked-scaffold_1-processed-gene-7.24-mRNA-1 protein AED:1.00 eAED:1.00 QI:0/-1/0/0/-1/1/1/0/150